MFQIKVLFILLVSLSLGGVTEVRGVDSTQSNLDRAVSYLSSVAYNPELHLCREAPRVAPDVYWISSDNLLALKALEPYNQTLSSTIRSELVRLAKLYNLPTSAEGVPLSLRYDVIMQDRGILQLPPRNVTHLILYNGSYLLKYDIANGTGTFRDWKGYADLLLLAALSNHNRGDLVNAMGNFTAAANMWDGLGLRDNATKIPYGEGQAPGNPHAYATYKLGLLLYVAGKLGIHLSFESEVINRIWLMQNQTSGGLFTHILPDGSRGMSDTNTETTTMVILGITSILQPVPEFDLPMLMLFFGFILSSVIVRRVSRHELHRLPVRLMDSSTRCIGLVEVLQ